MEGQSSIGWERSEEVTGPRCTKRVSEPSSRQGPANSNLLPLAESPRDQGSGASREISPTSPPGASSHPFGFSIRNLETRSTGSSPPLWSSPRVTSSVPLGATGLCSWMPRLGQLFASGPRQRQRRPSSSSCGNAGCLGPSPQGGSLSGGATSMGPCPSRPGGPMRKEAHCLQRNTFWGP
ncbi:hypothetical protein NN561_002550 [Cricetulus griseus]